MAIRESLFGSVRERLADSRFQFYLTGSRFFGNAETYSDWDYFTADSEAVRQFLIDSGFIDLSTLSKAELERRGYDFNMPYEHRNMQGTLTIFEHQRERVHVQIVEDPGLKWKIQTELRVSGFPWGIKDKRVQRSIWNAVFQISRFRVE